MVATSTPPAAPSSAALDDLLAVLSRRRAVVPIGACPDCWAYPPPSRRPSSTGPSRGALRALAGRGRGTLLILSAAAARRRGLSS